MHHPIREHPSVKLDEKDKAILRQLEMDARQPLSKIAKDVGLSKEVVNYRIKAMIRNKVIELFITPYNYTRMGYFQSKLLVKFMNFNDAFEKKLLSFLKDVKHIYWITHCSGDYDIQLIFQTRTMLQLEQSFFAFLNEFSKNITKRHFSIISKKYNLRHNCIYDDKIDMIDIAEFYDKTEMPPETDFEIMKLLKRNCRMPATEIAKNLKITPATVSARIKSMVKSRWIKGFFIRINLPLIGYYVYNIFYKFKNMDDETEKSIMNYLCSRKDVGYIGKMIGGWDFDIELQVRNEYDLHRKLNEINSRLHSNIHDYTYLFTVKKYPLYTSEI